MVSRAEFFFLLLGERRHVYLLAENVADCLAFFNDVIVEFRHGIRQSWNRVTGHRVTGSPGQ